MNQHQSKIRFDNEAIKELNELLAAGQYPKVFFLVDENTHQSCLIPLLQNLEELDEMEILEVEAGEKSKSVEVLNQLWMAMSELKADRSSLLVNVGGGVITDLGGFLASTYMRGIDFINFPTSLLAQVDASVGGKTAVNLEAHKNRIGIFNEPVFTGIVNDFLDTLPELERISGFAEMLKHGLIADQSYWKELCEFPITEHYPNSSLVQRSIEIKSKIVKSDFRESGPRKLLNFGHSIGHAFESIALEKGIYYPHGFAIAQGMIGESILSSKYLNLSENEMNSINDVIHSIFSKIPFDFEVEEMIGYIKMDKKNENENLNFSLLKSIGEAEFNVEVEEKDIVSLLKFLKTND